MSIPASRCAWTTSRTDRARHSWYVYERLGGIELRPSPPGDANFASVNDAPTDWARFPEFYAEYFAHEQEYESPGGDWACVAPVTYTGGGAEHVLAGTDCGFAQGPYIQRVHPTIQWAKLRSLAEGAELASRALPTR
jgi:hypothetical protein